MEDEDMGTVGQSFRECKVRLFGCLVFVCPPTWKISFWDSLLELSAPRVPDNRGVLARWLPGLVGWLIMRGASWSIGEVTETSFRRDSVDLGWLQLRFLREKRAWRRIWNRVMSVTKHWGEGDHLPDFTVCIAGLGRCSWEIWMSTSARWLVGRNEVNFIQIYRYW